MVVQRRAIRAGRALSRGARLTRSDLVVLRPCPEGALAPYQIDLVLGKTLSRDVPEGDLIGLADVSA